MRRNATFVSLFYEQKSLEEIVRHVAQTQNERLFEFGANVNFGWWRMYHSNIDYTIHQSKFNCCGNIGVGIEYDGKPLQSIHAHIQSKKGGIIQWFNTFTKNFTKHNPVKIIRDKMELE